jgi:peptidyl-prolyl cis-trans isomerase C
MALSARPRRAWALGAALAALAASAGAALANGDLVRVTLGTSEETVSAAEAGRRWSLLSQGQRRALGASDEAARQGFVAMLREEALLAAAAKRASLPARFEVAEVQRRALARAVIDRAGDAIGAAGAVSDADVASYYEAHTTTYVQPARVQVWRVLVKGEPRARELLAKVKAGIAVADWVTLAREESVDEATKLRGGNLGFLDDQGVSDDAPVSADPAVLAAAKGVPDGAIVGDVVPERGHYAIVWRRSSLPAVRRSVEEVAPQIRGVLWRERRARAEEDAVKAIVAARVTRRDDDALTAIDALVVKAFEDRRAQRP